MDGVDAMDIGREAIWTMLKIGGPILFIALVVGLVVSLFQALTQMQELTLSFVPKILTIFLALLILMPYMVSQLSSFTLSMMDRIVALN
jgi:flagellar biosynthetic protein FliQ|tara:strand:- start:4135 stop:4401 length:267 start_codon:yes stop_codon:yes gene_type:complete